MEKDTDVFKNKNIFITQNNPNDPFFDLAYFIGKNMNPSKLVYIQVKKSLSKNWIGLPQAKKIFEDKKNNFSKLFGLLPDEFNLVYITLFNDKIKEAFLEQNKKISNLRNDFDPIPYSLHFLDSFCERNFIQLYYYEPKIHKFYKKGNNNFEKAKLDL